MACHRSLIELGGMITLLLALSLSCATANAQGTGDIIIRAGIQDWYCLCYQEIYQDDVVDATACRASEAVCQRLARRVEEGGRTIIAGSLSRECTHVKSRHPEEQLGGRGDWLPSARPGALWTPSGCLIPDPQGARRSSERVRRRERFIQGDACKRLYRDHTNPLAHFWCISSRGGGVTTVRLKGASVSVSYSRGGVTWEAEHAIPRPPGPAPKLRSRRLISSNREAIQIDVQYSSEGGYKSYSTQTLIYLLDRTRRLIFNEKSGEFTTQRGSGSCVRKISSKFTLTRSDSLIQEISEGCGADPEVRRVLHSIDAR